jgi:uncharacterized protein
MDKPNAPRGDGRFDAQSLARRGAVIEGRVDPAALPRVRDLLAGEDSASTLNYRIAGSADGSGHPALEIALTGAVSLTCQRCLRVFAWPVDQRTLLLLARDESELARLDEADREHEVVLANAPLDPMALVEDELLLTMPYVPRCPESECPALPGAGAG